MYTAKTLWVGFIHEANQLLKDVFVLFKDSTYSSFKNFFSFFLREVLSKFAFAWNSEPSYHQFPGTGITECATMLTQLIV
jgi:hypothetical protein